MSKKVLIVSDGKPGHLNQSIAFCKIKNFSYDILEVSFKLKIFKLFSYLFDSINFYTDSIFSFKNIDLKNYDAIVSTGSNTYYFNKVVAKKNNKKSIVLMLPKSYNYKTFDYIIAQNHDNPPKLNNIITIPLNLSYNQPKGFIKKLANKKSLAIVLGGDNNIFTMEKSHIKKDLDEIFANYPNHLKYITTSRRTPKNIEELLKNYTFDYEVIYSKTPNINPISDFIEICDQFFITIDSTSMLSEIRANSKGKVHILQLDSKKENTKFHKLAKSVSSLDSNIDFEKLLQKVVI